ncbi:MAG: hypothetical protein HZB46_03795 [Solirubrobacterales bacterium]|nr:hypothetical protein [Solirubrobacterales bacterium]
MEQDGTTTPGASRVDLCPDCGREFVVPVALLDIVDEGLYLVALECKNCGRLAVGVHEDAEMEQVDRAMDRQCTELEAMADILDIAEFIHEIELFTTALRADIVLPEDF